MQTQTLTWPQAIQNRKRRILKALQSDKAKRFYQQALVGALLLLPHLLA